MSTCNSPQRARSRSITSRTATCTSRPPHARGRECRSPSRGGSLAGLCEAVQVHVELDLGIEELIVRDQLVIHVTLLRMLSRSGPRGAGPAPACRRFAPPTAGAPSVRLRSRRCCESLERTIAQRLGVEV